MNTKTVMALLAAVAALSSFGAIRAVTPVAWNGDPKCWQLARNAEKRALIATNGGAKVVFIGDSITHFWERQGKKQWAKYFAGDKYRPLNLGYGADRTEHVLWRLTKGGELDGYEAKCIFLMIGTNNTGHFPVEQEPPVDTILGIKEILRVIAEKQPKARVILSAIFPRGADAKNPWRMRNEIVNKEIAKFADGKKVIWCDFTDKFVDAEGNLSRELFPDLLHPNGTGYEIWASAALPLIDRVLGATEDEVIPSVWPSHPVGYNVGAEEAAQPISGFPENPKWWKDRCLEKRNEIVDNGNVEYDIVMVGDSITHRWEREGGEGRELFAELKKTYRILNLGYGGDKTQHAIWRMENGELEGYKAKLFTLMIGTNNRDRDYHATAKGVKRVLDVIRAKHPEAKVLLMPIFPRGATPADKQRVINEKVNAIIKDYADGWLVGLFGGKTVYWLDFNDKFLEEGGILTKKVMNDLLHPNEKGYQIWWDAIKPTVREICGK